MIIYAMWIIGKKGDRGDVGPPGPQGTYVEIAQII